MLRHCTALAAAILLVSPIAARAQQQSQPQPGETAFAIFLRGTPIGREQGSLARTDSGWILTANGRSAAPVDFTLNRFEIKYSQDWQPLEMTLEARVRNVGVIINTSFTLTTAINEIAQNNTKASKQDQISARTIVVPNNVFTSYEVLAARLWGMPVNSEVPLYVAASGEIKVHVDSVTPETLTGPNGTLVTRRFELTLPNPDRPVKALVVTDEHLRLVRFEIPSVGVQAVREDVSTVAVRAQVEHNPTDSEVTIAANGFNLAGTVTTPPSVAGRLRYPAVLLVGGTSPSDRDQMIGGVPVFARLARALADAGQIVLRYDRRGTGQSGGRTDTATLADYADDARAAVKWLEGRDDIDKRRLVIVGQMDGGPVALLAAAGDKEIDGVVTIDAAGATGAELILLQQQALLDELHLGEADRQARIDLQKKIQNAVVNGGSWEGIPVAMRRQADTPWFKSVLTYDPAKVLLKVRQPILILHADLDRTVPPEEADRLGELAKGRKKAAPSEVVHIADAGKTLTPAGSAQISAKVISAIVDWIKKL